LKGDAYVFVQNIWKTDGGECAAVSYKMVNIGLEVTQPCVGIRGQYKAVVGVGGKQTVGGNYI
jgi:hypothetical protein